MGRNTSVCRRGFNNNKKKTDEARADMEMKKSVSDTERALRSYGAVCETTWTTDKGECRAPRSLSASARGDARCGCASTLTLTFLIYPCIVVVRAKR